MKALWRSHWREIILVVGVALLVLGLSGWHGGGTYRDIFGRSFSRRSGFPMDARAMMAVGAALLTVGLINRRR